MSNFDLKTILTYRRGAHRASAFAAVHAGLRREQRLDVVHAAGASPRPTVCAFQFAIININLLLVDTATPCGSFATLGMTKSTPFIKWCAFILSPVLND